MKTLKMINIGTVIFDFDGVIANTEADIVAAVQAVQRNFGTKVLESSYISSFIGKGAPYLIN
ncbi:MAG: HAD family hydrolase, partial [Clostridiales bacterium]|nr:HAD family hydrolase [Clostridiales bacterium]